MRRFGWLCATLLCSLSVIIQAQDPVFKVRVDVPIVALEAVAPKFGLSDSLFMGVTSSGLS